MIQAGKGKDRRKHQRYDIPGGAFALVNWEDSELLGSIEDISTGGLRLSHIDENETIDSLTRLSVNLITDKIFSENFAARNIWSQAEKNGFAGATVKMKYRGIAFEDLDDNLRAQIDTFIHGLVKK